MDDKEELQMEDLYKGRDRKPVEYRPTQVQYEGGGATPPPIERGRPGQPPPGQPPPGQPHQAQGPPPPSPYGPGYGPYPPPYPGPVHYGYPQYSYGPAYYPPPKKVSDPMNRLAPWTVLIIFVLIIMVSTILVVPVMAYYFLESEGIEDFLDFLMSPPAIVVLVLLVIQDTVFVVIPYLIYFRTKLLTWAELGMDWDRFGQRMVLGLVIGAGIGGFVLLVISAIGYDTSGGMVSAEDISLQDYVILLIGGCIVAPIGEEFFFRGVTFKGVMKYMDHKSYKYSFLFPMLFSSMLFAGVHGYDPVGTSVVFMAGIVFALMFHKTGSLVPCMFCHGAYNAVIITAEYMSLI